MRHLALPLVIVFTHALFGQAPEAFSYQAVARDANGDGLASTSIGLSFRIHQGNPGGVVEYGETQATVTNALGLFTVQVGNGTVTQGNFAAIDWGNGPFFLEVGMDPTGGTTYAPMGTQQLLSVPYALRAKSADADNDEQQLWISGDTIFISNGNFIVLPARFTTNCTDGLQNGDETGVDCGGSVCVSCATLCSDGVQNGDETGVDRGGTSCTPCAACPDGDSDWWTTCSGDCTDADPTIHPGAAEVCNDGVDNNCNGTVDEDADALSDGRITVDASGLPAGGYLLNARTHRILRAARVVVEH